VFDGHYGSDSVKTSSCLTWTVLLFLALASPAGAKCGRLLLSISGELRGDPGHTLTVRIDTVPDANENQPAPVRDGDAFTAKLLFDPTKGYTRVRGHDCSRDPRVVRILLLDGDDVRQEKELSFAKDFVEESPNVYRAREPVILDAGGDPKSERRAVER
jgi:hypothetical protein